MKHSDHHHHTHDGCCAAKAAAGRRRAGSCLRMTVDRATAKHFVRHEGRTYFSAGCKRIRGHPGNFGGRPIEPTPKGTQYTCPMHPEIVRDKPGSCPKCGMALEPMGVPTGDEGPNPELVDFTRRFWVSAALSVPLLIVAMAPMLGLTFQAFASERTMVWLELALASPVVLWAALPFFHRGWDSLVNRSPNMWTLSAVGAAHLYSVAPRVSDIFPSVPRHGGTGRSFRGCRRHRRAGLLPGAELRAREKTGSAIRAC